MLCDGLRWLISGLRLGGVQTSFTVRYHDATSFIHVKGIDRVTVSDLNQILEIIKKRRSWRAYDVKPVPRKLIQAVIDAGNEAPSGMNSQPWRFVVVENEAMRKKLFDAAYPKWRKVYEDLMKNPSSAGEAAKYGKMEDPVYYRAPVIIFVIGKGAVNCALCCENMMLAAESLRLGNCYVYFGSLIKDNPEIIETLELGEKDEIYGPILLGYPKGDPEVPIKKPARVKWV